jgi:hypothetical protein
MLQYARDFYGITDGELSQILNWLEVREHILELRRLDGASYLQTISAYRIGFAKDAK